MQKIKFTVPISRSLPFMQKSLVLSDNDAEVELDLTEGEHVFESEPVIIGTYYHFRVFALLTFGYSYSSALNEIKIAGPDSTSRNQLKIHTYLDGDKEFLYTHAAREDATSYGRQDFLSRFADDSKKTKKSKGILVKEAIETVIGQLLGKGGVRSIALSSPAPVITPDNYAEYHQMLLPEENAADVPSLREIISLQKKIESVFDDVVLIPTGTDFANVIGSTKDPKGDRLNWIKLWMEKCNGGASPLQCASLDTFLGTANTYACTYTRFDSRCFGGHVILSATPEIIDPYTDPLKAKHAVYIAPICISHNNHDDVYMRNVYDQGKGILQIVRLKNYLTPVS